MTEPRVAVIGAGLAGLATGCLLRLNGYAVDIFEHADRPGGVARTRWEPGLRVEGGPYFLIGGFPGLAPYALYQCLGLVPWEGLEPVDLYAELVDQPTHTRLAITRDLERLEADLRALAPEDGALIRELIGGARAFSHFDPARAGFERPPELKGFGDKLAMAWHSRRQLRIFGNKRLLGSTLSEWIAPARSAALRELVLGFFAYPVVPPWFVMMMLGLLAQGQLARIVKSPEDFIGRLVQRLDALGGNVHYGAAVRRIAIEDGRATGIELVDGTYRNAHAVVSTVDTGQLLDDLLDGAGDAPDMRRRWTDWPKANPVAFVNFLTRGSWHAPWYTQARVEEPLQMGDFRTDRVSVRFFPSGTGGAGADETAVECSFDAPLAWFEGDIDARRHALAGEATARLESLFPGFAGRVVHTEVITPDVFVRAVRAPRGVTGGYLPTPVATMTEARRTIPGVARLYLAGQWAVAGAGVMAVLYSAQHAAQLVCHADRRRYTTRSP